MSAITSHSSTSNALTPSLEKEKYYYYCFKNGCDLNQLVSVIANGILPEPHYRTITVTTHDVLGKGRLSALFPGVIIKKDGLETASTSPRKTKNQDSISPVLVQVLDKISRENIVGITIPENYRSPNDDYQLGIFPREDRQLVQRRMNTLQKFYQKTLDVSLLADETLKRSFAMYRDYLKTSTQFDQYTDQLRERLNEQLREKLKVAYKETLKKERVSLLDIVKFHVQGKLPIYLPTGELVSKMEIKDAKNRNMPQNETKDAEREKRVSTQRSSIPNRKEVHDDLKYRITSLNGLICFEEKGTDKPKIPVEDTKIDDSSRTAANPAQRLPIPNAVEVKPNTAVERITSREQHKFYMDFKEACKESDQRFIKNNLRKALALDSAYKISNEQWNKILSSTPTNICEILFESAVKYDRSDIINCILDSRSSISSSILTIFRVGSRYSDFRDKAQDLVFIQGSEKLIAAFLSSNHYSSRLTSKHPSQVRLKVFHIAWRHNLVKRVQELSTHITLTPEEKKQLALQAWENNQFRLVKAIMKPRHYDTVTFDKGRWDLLGLWHEIGISSEALQDKMLRNTDSDEERDALIHLGVFFGPTRVLNVFFNRTDEKGLSSFIRYGGLEHISVDRLEKKASQIQSIKHHPDLVKAYNEAFIEKK